MRVNTLAAQPSTERVTVADVARRLPERVLPPMGGGNLRIDGVGLPAAKAVLLKVEVRHPGR